MYVHCTYTVHCYYYTEGRKQNEESAAPQLVAVRHYCKFSDEELKNFSFCKILNLLHMYYPRRMQILSSRGAHAQYSFDQSSDQDSLECCMVRHSTW